MRKEGVGVQDGKKVFESGKRSKMVLKVKGEVSNDASQATTV